MKRLIVSLLFACMAHPYAIAQKNQRPQVQTPGVFRGDTATQPDRQSLADLKWFEIFNDEKLQDLINDALSNNYDLREAVARVEAARANLGITRSEQFPSIIAGGDTINQRQSRSSA